MTDQVQTHILAKYNLLKKVGSGAYGHVWKVSDKKNQQTFALKKIFDAFQHSTDAQRTYREIMFLSQFKHENIIKLHNVFKADNDKDLYLIFQFMEADLHNAIGQKILKDIHNRYILYQIIKGIKYLHSASVIHRDLKPSNILINSDCHIKICDFGLARSLVSDEPDKDVVLTEEVATRWYRAPEVLLGSKNYGAAADVWSIGCILAQILMGKPFFPGNSTLNQLERILYFVGTPEQSDIESLQANCAQTMIKSISVPRVKPIKEWFKPQTPHQALDLVAKMLHFNPNKRITIEQILKHQYMAQFRQIKSQISSKKSICPPVSDNKKLNLKQYRSLIYESIQKIFNHPSQRLLSIQKKNPFSSNAKDKDKRQSKPESLHSTTPKGFYNSIQRKSPKISNMTSHSAKKGLTHSMSQNSFYPTKDPSIQDESIKRKSSLKELLRQRRPTVKNDKQKISPSFLNSTNTSVMISQPVQQQASGGQMQYKYIKRGAYGLKESKSFYNGL